MIKFLPEQQMCKPNILAFRRILESFKCHASVRPQQATGKIIFTALKVQRVKNFFEVQPEAHIPHDVDAL